MSNPEHYIDYGVARDMATVANYAHNALQEAENNAELAWHLQGLNVPDVALKPGSLAVLEGIRRVALNSFNHANESVPNFRTQVQGGNINTDATTPETTDPETLTPEEQAYREKALEGFGE